MATQLQSNIKLLVLKQGISTSDELGSFHASFNPLQPAQPFSTGNWLIDPTPEEHLFLRQNKLESITFLLRIKPLTFHSSVENLRVARGHVATKSPSPRVMARHLAESIVVHDLKVKFRCSESLMKAHITPVDHQKTHGDSFEVVIRLSQSECVVSWTIFRQVILPAMTTNTGSRSCSFRSPTQCCQIT
ncbi:hypothetical protein Pst134EA_004916 [Puccinia striiformis f. sp. tritici]|uniref:Uncharacterized protein n=1 Tax=Puccinia striiformis f. sp. tritici PST-78 TaxID=1165861 RepID=A0A0L0VHE6_9BASI|nr:hypothetical protein Pst134EA_004916 [Puccinia striiformis f. sp. tritici]KAH9462059.1 hypothetical protein Pst134EB_005976 [Puccinia striiformis f. sp. tritici]KAH9471006.1 hypothetical protein Pst134EA_004916 [Puccinia striiformis f. sp. tritici]KNE98641.1 hypothetical protein PSTG_08010 [Puccinia striiformis f. sp. tritici PST-78]